MAGQIQRIQTGSEDVDRLQSNIVPPLNQLLGIPFLNGRLLKSIGVVAGQNNAVEHKLGREYQGYWITGIDADANIWTSSVQNKAKFITLASSSDVTVDLWVF